MIFSNLHTHCWFCDGHASMEEFLRFAIAKGFDSYGISSHAPLPFDTKWTLKKDDYDDYRREHLRLKEKYADKIQFYVALEIDYLGDFSNAKNEYFKDKTFDYIIGSVHYVDKIPGGRFWNIFGTQEVFQEGLDNIFDGDIKAAMLRYFECEKEMIKLGGIDFIAHSDKLASRASKYEGFSINETWYKNAFGDMLQCVKDHNLKLEINTKSVEEKGTSSPHPQFYPLIREMQIPVVVNTDAHNPDNVDSGLRKTYQLLKQAGFKSINVFYDNKWQETEL